MDNARTRCSAYGDGCAREVSICDGGEDAIFFISNMYKVDVSVSTQQIIQVEYNVSRNISVVALRDQNGVVSFDFRIRRHKK